jgi:hypothetical protein
VLKDRVTALLPASLSASSASAARRNAKRSAKPKTSKKKVEAVEPGVLRLRGQKGKYQISDITGRLAERQNVTLHVGWNFQPWVGALFWAPGTGAVPRTAGTIVPSETFDFPELKGSKKAAAEEKVKTEKASE